MKSVTYKDAGVDVKKGDLAVDKIKKGIHSTFSKNVLTNLGNFGGMYELFPEDIKNPVLVSSVDGVGTKLKIAVLSGKHDTVGEDLVNHCVNDIAVGGAKPLFFLDYYACDSLNVDVFEQVVSGFVRGCKNNKCALIGGETAEMPDMYQKGEYDLSGTIVGIVDKNKIINGSNIKSGDIIIGVESNGLHTNGYSLARKILLDNYQVNSMVPELGRTISEELLRVHFSYLLLIQEAVNSLEIHGISHITGGGIEGNTKRILPAGLNLKIDWGNWDILPVFKLIKSLGNVPDEDMRQAFNLGIGLCFIISAEYESEIKQTINNHQYKSYVIGEII